MIYKLDEKLNNDEVGNKAYFISILHENKFKVPKGIVLPYKLLDGLIDSNSKLELNNILNNLNYKSLENDNQKIINIFNQIQISEEIKNIIFDLLKETGGDVFSVRSSASVEDTNYSFAGKFKTILGARKERLDESLIAVYKSLYSAEVLKFVLDNNIDIKTLNMSIIIQEMIVGDISGVTFTVDPITGDDKVFRIEIVNGTCDNLVSGVKTPNCIKYNWYDEKIVYVDSNVEDKTKELLNNYYEFFLNLQVLFNVPVDIEWTISNNELYILQVRPITSILCRNFEYIWTTSDYRDGGIASEACKPMMWSFYEYAWENALKKFLKKYHVLSKKYTDSKLTEMFYSFCYWNLTVVKNAMSKIPGYIESEFDDNYGIDKNYDGVGDTNKMSIFNVFKLVSILFIVFREKKYLNKNNDKRILQLKKNIEYINSVIECPNFNIDEIKKVLFDLFIFSEGYYFNHIYFNTVFETIAKKVLKRYLSHNDYTILLSQIDDISHMRIVYDIWELSRKIRNDSDEIKLWNSKYINSYNDIHLSKYYKDICEMLKEYGHHSKKELDISYERFSEAPDEILKLIKQYVLLDDDNNPHCVDNKEKAREIIDAFNKRHNNLINGVVLYFIKNLKSIFWWKEEFRDYSIRLYSVLRKYLICLSKHLKENGIVDDVSDIWFLKITDIYNYYLGKNNLRDIINKNKKYYLSFKGFKPLTEIYPLAKDNIMHSLNHKQNVFKGVSASCGLVKGRVKVVNSYLDLEDLSKYDILVSKFIDTGWTSSFINVKGIVTEYGGTLCHTAIIAREYGIPSVINCNGIVDKLKDGQVVIVNANDGLVEVIN